MRSPAYKFYPTLLDSYNGYLNSSKIYNEFWGFSENPSLTEEEFEQKQFDELIDKINRVPFESEKADKGTAFNEVIDCIIENRKSEKMEITKGENDIQVKYKEYSFSFNKALCKEIAKMLDGAITQVKVEGILSTRLGDVLLYGNMDHVLPFLAEDLKTTSKYNAFKFRANCQHLVYPFCLRQMGNKIDDFLYLVTDFKTIFEEHYRYDEAKAVIELTNLCEGFIEFIEQHKHLITDKKVFAMED